jgi:cell division protein FtsW
MKGAATTLFIAVLALLALGMVMLVSASTGQAQAKYLTMQPIWCALGLLVCGLAALGDYRWLKRFPWTTWALFASAVVLLVLVLVPGFGVRRNGATRWLSVAQFQFQPSELAKVALIILLAWYGERYGRFMNTFWRGLIVPALLAGVVLALVFTEPDVGTTLLIAAVTSLMLVIGGVRWSYFLPPVLLAAIAVTAFIWHDPMRSERVYSWLHVEETKLEKGLQAYQAMVALGSGGVAGKGLGDGRQKLGFVPEHHTDFIFSVIGEELGLIATLAVLTAFLAILICGIYISWNASDTFGMLLGSGITFLITMQAVINIGVVTGSLPNKGLSLPFISYGGSNLVIMLGCVGLLLNIARHPNDRALVPSGMFDSDHPLARPS